VALLLAGPGGFFQNFGSSHGNLGPSVTCDCYLAPVSFLPPIQGLGCSYICACPDGLVIGQIPPNTDLLPSIRRNFQKCFLELNGPLFLYQSESEPPSVLVLVNSRLAANSQAISCGVLSPRAL